MPVYLGHGREGPLEATGIWGLRKGVGTRSGVWTRAERGGSVEGEQREHEGKKGEAGWREATGARRWGVVLGK